MEGDVVFMKKKPPPPGPSPAQLAAKAAKTDEAPATMPLEVKNAIIKARTEKKMTQKELGHALNIQASEIQKYEQGKLVPTNALLARMDKILGTKLPRIKKTSGIPKELEAGDTDPSLRSGPA